MNWITASILMLFSSVALYLFVRKSNELKTPQVLTNLAMFLVPVVMYSLAAFSTSTRLVLSQFELTIIIIQGAFFSYLGNLLSLKGIDRAPNPGYSLIISKSYIVFTTFASVYLFDAAITVRSVLAILGIVGFSSLIMFDHSKENADSNSVWLSYTLGAFFCWGFLALSSKYLLNLGVPILTRLIYSMFVATLLILGEIIIRGVRIQSTSKPQLLILMLVGISGSSYAYFMQVGFNLAPNVGYVNAVNAASIALLTFASSALFKDELTLKKIIGVIGVTLGLVLLFV